MKKKRPDLAHFKKVRNQNVLDLEPKYENLGLIVLSFKQVHSLKFCFNIILKHDILLQFTETLATTWPQKKLPQLRCVLNYNWTLFSFLSPFAFNQTSFNSKIKHLGGKQIHYQQRFVAGVCVTDMFFIGSFF